MNDLRQLRYFIAVAEKLHFGLAARSLHITQPPLSRQIAALEKELGVQLLVRHSRQAQLTPAGQRFLEDGKAVLALYDQACRNARLAQQGSLGNLKIGFMMHAAYSSVPVLTRQFIAACPQVNLELSESLPLQLLDELLKDRFDAVITFSPQPMTGVRTQVIHRESLCLVVPADHPLTSCVSVSAAELCDEPLIVAPEHIVPTLHQAIRRYFSDAGFEPPRTRLQSQLQQSIVSLVAEGLGIALVPRSVQKMGMAGVHYCELVDAPMVEQVLAWRSANPNPALPHLLAVARADGDCQKN